MKQEEIMWLNNQEYQILAVEHPNSEPILEELPEILTETESESLEEDLEPFYKGRYVLQDRKLKWESRENETSLYQDCLYSGGVIIARELNAIPLAEGRPACFQYDTVLELIFENGNVTALADHSRAMKKIAKNLEYRLRSLKKRRDVYVIRRFLKKTFVRKYPVKWVKRG